MPSSTTDAQYAAESDKIKTSIDQASLTPRRLSGQVRRLTSVTQAYAGQSVTQCAEDDADCLAGITSTTQAPAQTLSGTLTMTTDNCAALGTTDGMAGIAAGIAKVAGASASATTVTVTCAATRRLEERRLTTQTANIDYSIMVPAGSAVSAATMMSNLQQASAATFQTEILAELQTRSITATITVTNVGAVTSTVTEASIACPSPVRGGFIALFSWLAFMAAGNPL